MSAPASVTPPPLTKPLKYASSNKTEPRAEYPPQVNWLLERGWRMVGEPLLNTDRWYDPTKPKKPTDVPNAIPLDLSRKNPDTGKMEHTFQTRHDPAAMPMSRQQAVDLQSEREEEAVGK